MGIRGEKKQPEGTKGENKIKILGKKAVGNFCSVLWPLGKKIIWMTENYTLCFCSLKTQSSMNSTWNKTNPSKPSRKGAPELFPRLVVSEAHPAALWSHFYLWAAKWTHIQRSTLVCAPHMAVVWPRDSHVRCSRTALFFDLNSNHNQIAEGSYFGRQK